MRRQRRIRDGQRRDAVPTALAAHPPAARREGRPRCRQRSGELTRCSTRSRADRGRSNGRGFALVVGDPSPRKNLGMLLDIWEDVAHVRSGLVLRRRRSRRVAQPRHPAPARCLARLRAPWCGSVGCPDGQLRWAYEHATKTALVPSREEGFGLPVVEALTLGAPVIASTDPAALRSAGLPGARRRRRHGGLAAPATVSRPCAPRRVWWSPAAATSFTSWDDCADLRDRRCLSGWHSLPRPATRSRPEARDEDPVSR